MIGDRAIVALAEQLAGRRDQHGSHRNLVPVALCRFGEREGVTHPVFVV
jgi:hypothetical protein